MDSIFIKIRYTYLVRIEILSFMKNVYISAQEYGFGPTALMLSTLDALDRKYHIGKRISLYGTDNLKILLNGNNRFQVYEKMSGVGEFELLNKRKAYKEFPMFVSFFDPAPILYSWFYDKLSLYHDGFFDFWDIESFEGELEGDLNKIREFKLQQNIEGLIRWYNVNIVSKPHKVIFAAHYFANDSYVRNASTLDSTLNRFPELKHKPIKKVACIVDPYLDVTVPALSEDRILVSLGGSLAPVISIEQNVHYARQMLHLIQIMASHQLFERYHWDFVCNPLIHKQLVGKDDLKNKKITIHSSLGMQHFMDMMKQSAAVITPAGYGTIQEACYCKKPIFLIPEQNSSQPFNMQVLKKYHFPYKNSMSLTYEFNKGKLPYKDKEEDTAKLYRDIDTLLKKRTFPKKFNAKIAVFARLLQDESKRQHCINQQLQSLYRMPGGFDGAYVIAEGMYRMFSTISS